MSKPDPQKRYTYADLLTWDDGQRWELFDGVPVALASPSTQHQAIVTALTVEFGMYLKGKTCKVFPAPFDVRLCNESDSDNEITTVVIPDVSVICDPNKIDSKGCKGAPDLIVEILSPSTIHEDKGRKFYLYEQYGVKEFWIVDPDYKVVEVYQLVDRRYWRQFYALSQNDEIKVGIFEDLTISLKDIFGE
ncbi:Uma2 family endonuclease [Thermoflavimicrobium dichotomicum]|uniref:Endonuclease, Uma2 family (Restriction endonuclease fold) n=1 Tax=Thermoflavimicrobium dichotomicum TaxID=46223 RepID=A0A1I3UU43_9BACL|nr:Uma2 family endonuclease [Thermoflavimicrobium dichotomicum]SFJ85377.1 Endonuclease, Uma2 family (restriction endonuclease fold) [Thermoflavimicrobium dichotomicum]